MSIQSIHSQDAPAPAGHYSQGVVHAGLLYVSGQLPVDPQTRKITGETVEVQARQVFANVDAVLKAGGSRRSRVLSVRIYITDIALWSRVNAEYAAFFQEHKPARAVIPTGPLHHGALLEMEAVAALDDPVQVSEGGV